MTRPTRIEINCTTGAVQEIELTDAEIQQRELDAIEASTRQAEAEAEAARLAAVKESRDAKLLALGLTAEELSL